MVPPTGAFVTSRTLPIMGLVRDEAFMNNRDYVEVMVNGQDRYEYKIRDGYFFSGEVFLEKGANVITVEKQNLSVFFGDGDSPPGGYAKMYGHLGIEDTCDECHTADEQKPGSVVLNLQESPETLCNWCHLRTGNRKQAKPVSVHQPVQDGQCLACHLPHAGRRPAILKAERRDICRPCHAAVYEDLKTKSHVHGPLNVGDCMMCHNVHSAPEKFLLSVPEKDLCYKCHGGADLRTGKGPELGRHPGIDDGRCHDCHTGHASNNPKMMKKIVNNLCVECHPEKSHNFHEEKGFSIYICGRCHDIHNPDAPHLVINESRKLCDTCHLKLFQDKVVHKVAAEKTCFECHGFHQRPLEKSQAETCHRCHPEDEVFNRKHPVKMSPSVKCSGCHSPHAGSTADLTYAFRHKPFADKKCGECHQTLDERRGAAGGDGGENDICYKCHPGKKIPNPLPVGLVVHKPMIKGSCRSCHLTHNSNYPSLLVSTTLDLCGNCHSFVKKIKSQAAGSIHPPYKEGRCGQCHDVHLGMNAKLLKKPPRELCLDCHQKTMEASPGQAFAKIHKPAAGECGQCHVGHSSRQADLLKDKPDQLCRECHAKVFRLVEMPSVKSVHAPLQKGNCGGCHGLHGSNYTKLLLQEGNGLCLTCHKKMTKGLHHQYDDGFQIYETGSMEGKPLACLVCHKSHASSNTHLIASNRLPICKDCHQL